MRFRECAASAKAAGNSILAFNVVDLASAQGVLRAASILDEPVILQLSARTVAYYSAPVVVSALGVQIDRAGVNAFIHLDHCSDDQTIGTTIEAGFDGIMTDGSRFSYNENADWTRRWVEKAHEREILVEGELTSISGVEDGFTGNTSVKSDPKTYAEFANFTGVDLLGADIGTAHGNYRAAPMIDYEFLANVCHGHLPGMVIHGASGLDAVTLRRMCEIGVTKINFSTDLKAAWVRAVTNLLSASTEPLAALQEADEAIEFMALEKWHFCRGGS